MALQAQARDLAMQVIVAQHRVELGGRAFLGVKYPHCLRALPRAR